MMRISSTFCTSQDSAQIVWKCALNSAFSLLICFCSQNRNRMNYRIELIFFSFARILDTIFRIKLLFFSTQSCIIHSINNNMVVVCDHTCIDVAVVFQSPQFSILGTKWIRYICLFTVYCLLIKQQKIQFNIHCEYMHLKCFIVVS